MPRKPAQTTPEPTGPYPEQIYLRLRTGTLARIRAAAYKAYPDQQSASEWLRNAIEAALSTEDRKRA